ncbi:MAG: thiol reductant ABC exporter subunit CydD [Chloroflexi bacterium HGW-Chloroflexi-3]|nr:MAG: thiol reductant ABC exporter subunit CydD [Chloroflexi bacterium HGW-Chloroflexi-3]
MILHKKLVNWLIKFPYLFIFSIIFFEVGTILLIFQIQLISQLINKTIFINQSLDQLTKPIILIVVLIIFRGFFNFSGDVLAKKVAQKIKSLFRKKITDNLFQNNMDRRTHSGDLVTIFYDRIEAIEDYYTLFLPQVVLSILIPASVLFFVFPIDLLSGMVFILTAPLIPFFMFLIGRFSEKINKNQWRSLSNLSTFFLDSIRGMKTILIFNQQENHIKRIKRANDDYVHKSMSVLRITFLSALVLELLSTLSIAVVAVEVGLRLLYFKITFEQAFFILLIAPEFYLPLRNLGLRYHVAMNGVEAYKDIHSFITKKEISENRETATFTNKYVQKLNVEHLSIQYFSQNSPMISDFTYCFEKGKHYGIVGANGSGKSTFFHVLLRFIKPMEGKISIDGFEIGDIPRKQYYSLFSWLPQSPAIFNGSILENLLIANPENDLNNLEKILKIVELNDFIDTLPNNYHTEIQEFGKTISSGQKQRIGLARLLLRNSYIILCDEPTSFLDPISEQIISKVLEDYRKDKILLTIAHRIQTIQKADELLFFQKDKPISSGTFDNLMANNIEFQQFIKFYFGEKFND